MSHPPLRWTVVEPKLGPKEAPPTRRNRSGLPLLWMRHVALETGKAGLWTARLVVYAVLGFIGLLLLGGATCLLVDGLLAAVPASGPAPDAPVEPRAEELPPPRSPPRKVDPRAVRASSRFEHPADHAKYDPTKAFDGDGSTTWSPRRRKDLTGAWRDAVGEWLEAEVDDGRTLRKVVLTTGFDHTLPYEGDLFFKNAQLRRVRLVVDDELVTSLAIGRGERSATFDDLDVPLRPDGSRIRLVVDEVYPGEQWQDVCITEVAITVE